MWVAREEEAFGQTLEQGTRILEEHIARAKDRGAEGIGAAEAFQLHDTYGFPFDLTVELAAEQGLGVDSAGFENLMEDQRTRARASVGRGGRDEQRERAQAFAALRGLRHRVHRLRDRRAGDGGRRDLARERQGARQARRVPVLRHRRRPGPRQGGEVRARAAAAPRA